eukprot:TRINITY_DN1935_c0_g1_i2.p1 TRINITY_DN1935_c0_g1~~TRINITY_DN1935_c0_g1_i2.p1  ORF type:complete len:275 (+),score=67.06 TRINITY_DN1935_c0_g1_i2:23-826(+)
MEFAAVVQALGDLTQLKLNAESWDNVGMIVEPTTAAGRTVTTVFLCIDLTLPVLDEAIRAGAQLIVAYHPVLFSSIKRITPAGGPKAQVVLKAIQAGIAVYCPHTSLDSMNGGINDWLATLLGTGITAPITPFADGRPGGSGRIHTLDTKVPLSELIQRVKRGLNLEHIRVAIAHGHTAADAVQRIAICAGSGASLLDNVSADVYFSGEMGHHIVLNAVEKGTSVLLCEHTNTERGYLPQLRSLLTPLLPGVALIISQQDKEILVAQ